MRHALRTRHAVTLRVWSEQKKELINNVANWKDVFIENGANVVGTRHAVSVNNKVNTDNWCIAKMVDGIVVRLLITDKQDKMNVSPMLILSSCTNKGYSCSRR